MGDQSGKDLPGLTGFHRVWTFRLLSGPAFQMALPGNPPLNFQGALTVWKLVGPKALADSAKGVMENLGVKVDVFSEDESDEQAAIRLAIRSGKDLPGG